MPQEYYDAIAANRRSTFFLFGAFLVLIIVVGFFFGMWIGSELAGMVITFFLAVVWGLVSWFAGDKIVLGVSGARKVEKREYPHLFHTIEGLAIAAGVPTPEAYVIDDASPNAFATGRDPQHAKIAVTTGLLKMMNRQELEGVVAHEMSHVKNYDIRTMMVAAVLVGIVALIGNVFIRMMFYSGKSRDREGGNAALMAIGFLFILASPVVAQLIKMAISRKREFMADASAVELTRNPDGLRMALKKLAADHTPLKRANGATAHLYIEDPMDKEKKGFFKSLGGMFSTHPPIGERISRLAEYGMIG
ncbi:MAG: M48 family metallopeptidase [Candidatus Diapherotrites archaeon]|nr:M48 family metallopeptidase [Candidatus Diapherotrites archaeon]